MDVILAATARCFFSKTLDALDARPDPGYRDLEPGLRQALVVGARSPTADYAPAVIAWRDDQSRYCALPSLCPPAGSGRRRTAFPRDRASPARSDTGRTCPASRSSSLTRHGVDCHAVTIWAGVLSCGMSVQSAGAIADPSG